MTPKAPTICKTAAARKAFADLWLILENAGHDEEIYIPTVGVLATQMAIAVESATAVYTPIDPDTGKRTKRTLEEYLDGRNTHTMPELTIYREAMRNIVQIAGLFGGSPKAARAIGGIKEKTEDSPMMAYIKEANERMRRRTG